MCHSLSRFRSHFIQHIYYIIQTLVSHYVIPYGCASACHSSVLRHGIVPAVAPSQTSGSQRTPDDAVYLLVYTERHQFPFKITVQQRVIYLNASHRMNRKLKEIGRMAGCPVKLTFYVSRHGWASIAQSQRIPLPVISEALGHDSENTTRIYLALLDTSVVDRANSKVIRSVCKQETRHV